MLIASLFCLAGGASAIKYQCSKDFEPRQLLSVFGAVRYCGTPISLMQQACYDRLIQRSLTSYSVGYHMAAWERQTSTSFESLRYMHHLDVAQDHNWWSSIISALEDNHDICWYVRDYSADQYSKGSISGHLGSVFFVDNPFREPLMHVETDPRKVQVRNGNQCFSPDEDFKESRIKAISILLTGYNSEGVTSLSMTYRAFNGRVSTDLLLSATLARLVRNYRCPSGIRCVSKLVEGRPYLPESPKDFLRRVLSIIERDATLCFQETPMACHVERWYYLTGFDYRY
ncbi:hypothetical protein L249_6290 [Ophiocordyceps polyrhachis-furcata BCC 54312]|uniref:Uncharacterized protein n=1 Tax=Ophiocordyceps polyrhachis-furcata BCC 54312 TaxID=1330021 RepID=A0A367L103_9HYPO|nr:hypothetical protein L249_6290 [Ophiocordyceps polyrhachis-furcata BCC 54312]